MSVDVFGVCEILSFQANLQQSCTVSFIYIFLFKLFADCGAGIGRVTKNLLLPLFDTVDMVEQNPDFLQKAKDYLVCSQNFKILCYLEITEH